MNLCKLKRFPQASSHFLTKARCWLKREEALLTAGSVVPNLVNNPKILTVQINLSGLFQDFARLTWPLQAAE